MLKILINSITLDLPDNTDMAFEFNNSAVFDDYVAGSGSFDITFPGTPTNRKAFAYAHRFDAVSGLRKYATKVETTADNLFVGETILWEVVGGEFKTTIEQTSVRSLIADVKIGDLNFDDVAVGSDNDDLVTLANSVKNGGDHPVYFPMMHAPEFFGSDNGNVWVNFYNTNSEPPTYSITKEEYFLPYVPVIPFFHILKQLATDYSLTKVGDGFDLTEMRQAFYLNNYSLQQPNDPYTVHEALASVTNITSTWQFLLSQDYVIQEPDNHKLKFRAEIDNYQSGDSILVGIATYNGSIWQVGWFEAISAPGVQEVIVQGDTISETITKFQVFVQRISGNDPLSLINVSFDFYNSDVLEDASYDDTITISNHLPDVTISSFLNLIKNVFGIKIDFDDQKGEIKMVNRTNVLSSTPSNIEPINTNNITIEHQNNKGFTLQWQGTNEAYSSNKPYLGEFDDIADLPYNGNPGTYAFITRLSSYYHVIYDSDADEFRWEFVQFLVSENTVGELAEAETVSLEAKPLQMTSELYTFYPSLYVPVLPGKGYSEKHQQFDKMNELIIGIYRGMGETGFNGSGNQFYPYPFANSTPHTEVTLNAYDFGLLLDGDNNLYEAIHQAWYEMKVKSDTLSLQIDGKHIQIDELMNHRLYWDGILMILEQLTLTYNSKKSPKAKLKCLKVNN